MTSAIFSFLLIFIAVLTPPASKVKEAALDQEFEIRIGQQVSIKREGLTVSFQSVAEDSRCPQGVTCVWAGNARVLLKLGKAKKRLASMSLNTGAEPRQDTYRGYDVKLVGLNPYPTENAPIKRRDYVATLIVSRK